MDSVVNTLLHVACKLEHQEIQIAFKSCAEALLFRMTDLIKHRNFLIYRHDCCCPNHSLNDHAVWYCGSGTSILRSEWINGKINRTSTWQPSSHCASMYLCVAACEHHLLWLLPLSTNLSLDKLHRSFAPLFQFI